MFYILIFFGGRGRGRLQIFDFSVFWAILDLRQTLRFIHINTPKMMGINSTRNKWNSRTLINWKKNVTSILMDLNCWKLSIRKTPSIQFYLPRSSRRRCLFYQPKRNKTYCTWVLCLVIILFLIRKEYFKSNTKQTKKMILLAVISTYINVKN